MLRGRRRSTGGSGYGGRVCKGASLRSNVCLWPGGLPLGGVNDFSPQTSAPGGPLLPIEVSRDEATRSPVDGREAFVSDIAMLARHKAVTARPRAHERRL